MRVIKVYCAGGCRGGSVENNIGGWGTVLESNGYIKEIMGSRLNTNILAMRLTSVNNGLTLIKKPELKVVVYVQNDYIIRGANKIMHNFKSENWESIIKDDSVENAMLWRNLEFMMANISKIVFSLASTENDISLMRRAEGLVLKAIDEVDVMGF